MPAKVFKKGQFAKVYYARKMQNNLQIISSRKFLPVKVSAPKVVTFYQNDQKDTPTCTHTHINIHSIHWTATYRAAPSPS